jgi:hypothetical protein
MTKYAKIENNAVVLIVLADYPLDNDYKLVPEGLPVSIGSALTSDGDFNVQMPEPEPERVAYSSLEFMDLFTDAEESAIRILARSTDPTKLQISVKVEAFLARISVASVIYLDDKRVVKGIAALRQLGIIETDARQADILAGSPLA